MLLDPELLPDAELLPLAELLELEPASPLDVDALELLSAAPVPAVPEPAVPDEEPSPVPDACAFSNTLIAALLIWPDEFVPVALELELAGLAAEFDGVLASADACVVSAADVVLAEFVLSSVRSALAALDELAPVIDICCSWKP